MNQLEANFYVTVSIKSLRLCRSCTNSEIITWKTNTHRGKLKSPQKNPSELAKMAEPQPTPPNPSPPTNDAAQETPVVGAEAPEQIDGKVSYDVDAVFKEMNRSPFFMTQLPEDDGEENILVEALKSMAYEGTRDQIAENFKNQGNEAVGEKRWLDAREFYSKALAALKGPKIPSHLEDGNPMLKVVELDDDETCEKKERALEEACLANRALCQLEMSTSYSPFHCLRADTARHLTN